MIKKFGMPLTKTAISQLCKRMQVACQRALFTGQRPTHETTASSPGQFERDNE